MSYSIAKSDKLKQLKRDFPLTISEGCDNSAIATLQTQYENAIIKANQAKPDNLSLNTLTMGSNILMVKRLIYDRLRGEADAIKQHLESHKGTYAEICSNLNTIGQNAGSNNNVDTNTAEENFAPEQKNNSLELMQGTQSKTNWWMIGFLVLAGAGAIYLVTKKR